MTATTLEMDMMAGRVHALFPDRAQRPGLGMVDLAPPGVADVIANGGGRNNVRLSCSFNNHAEIERGARILGDVIRELRAG